MGGGAMSEQQACILANRAVLRLRGPDLRTFLQGIVSSDVDKVGPDRSLWSAFLTPQGKFLHEFFMAELDGEFLLDCEAQRLDEVPRAFDNRPTAALIVCGDS